MRYINPVSYIGKNFEFKAQSQRLITKTFFRFFILTAIGMGLNCIWSGETGADETIHPSLSEVILFGVRPVIDLEQIPYREDGRMCVKEYLDAIPPGSLLRIHNVSQGPADALTARRQNLVEQMVAILGEAVRGEATVFAFAVPLLVEWEGMSEGPVDEANFVDQWLNKRPQTSITPFLHLFKAHRLRAGYEAARAGHEKGLWPILARRYRDSIEKALGSGNSLILCIVNDLEEQNHVYLEGQGRP